MYGSPKKGLRWVPTVLLCCAVLCCAVLCCAVLCCAGCAVLPPPRAASQPRIRLLLMVVTFAVLLLAVCIQVCPTPLLTYIRAWAVDWHALLTTRALTSGSAPRELPPEPPPQRATAAGMRTSTRCAGTSVRLDRRLAIGPRPRVLTTPLAWPCRCQLRSSRLQDLVSTYLTPRCRRAGTGVASR
eukprot:COSAG01_NODE_1277_length_10932_cov_18.121942_12_plen_185_part_00